MTNVFHIPRLASNANRCVLHEQLANDGMHILCTIWSQFPKKLQSKHNYTTPILMEPGRRTLCRAIRRRNRQMTPRPTRNGTHRYVRPCSKVARKPRPWATGTIRILVRVSSSSSFVASVLVFRRTMTLSSVSSTSAVGTGFNKAVFTALHSSALHSGHFCTASHGRYGVDSDEHQRPVFNLTTKPSSPFFRYVASRIHFLHEKYHRK